MRNKEKCNTKYMLNWGFDIAEEYMMKKFSKFASQGWKLDSMTAMSFKFVKSQPQDKIFALDYQPNIKDVDEYKAIFASSGWELACFFGEFYIFSADAGTCEIYTDKTELKNKTNARFRAVLITWLVSLSLLVALSAIMYVNESCEWLFEVNLILAAVWGACTPWLIGLLNKKRKLR